MKPDRRVALLDTVFILDGENRMVFGGAERYLVQLYRLLEELGYEPLVFQPGEERHDLSGLRVQGIPWGEVEYSGLPELNRTFLEKTTCYDKTIYLAPFLAFPRLRPRSVVISHGIYWDYPTHPWASTTGPFRQEWYRRLHFAVTGADLFVSVDTNTLNWIRATWPGYEHRLVYVPNFVDTGVFRPAPKREGPLVVLYPRRLDIGRGLEDVKATATVLLRRHENVEFHFVGRGLNDRIEEEMRAWTAAHPGCRYYWVSMGEMPGIYRKAEIVLIPTRAAEGTSLSCLEAMASGKAVVCGRVGGLTDLIIDDYNGRLIDVTPESLVEAIEDLIHHPEKRCRLSEQALATARAFSLDVWKQRWATALRMVWGDEPSRCGVVTAVS